MFSSPWITIAALSFFLVHSVICSNVCTSKQTCAQCIAAGPDCGWCWRDSLESTDDSPMCDSVENLKKQKCQNIVSPQSKLQIIKNRELSNKTTAGSEALQVKPQEIRIQLRPNQVQRFTVEFKQAVDYPVDLYYLMDLSNSMSDDKKKLSELGNKLAEEMESITTNFRLGFGSFVDKTVSPFVSTHPEKLKEPCFDNENKEPCAPPYGFRNNMPLSIRTHEFAQKVDEAKISGNIDAPEGGFDAIMQAVVCEKEIGWRNDSRRILVYSSDNSYHYAGDGKLGGIVIPNDEKCHLNNEGYYTMSEELDYPSISQVNRQVREKKVNIIFAVTADQQELYDRLSGRLTGANSGVLSKDSSNVVDLVREQYEKIRSGVELTDDISDSNIKLSYFSKCLGSKEEKTTVCKGLKVDTNVTFSLQLEYSICPYDESKWSRTFHIFPIGLQDQLTVHLEMLCQCDCEKTGVKEDNSPKCSNGSGTFECGICNCNQNRRGKKCQCDETQMDVFEESLGCKKDANSKICSGVGTCHCGVCVCNQRQNPEEKYSGKFCECNNFSCDKKDDKICSDHGPCVCGECLCDKGWTGDDCSCKESKKDCMDDKGNECSGRGKCDCGACVCNRNGDEEYYGARCDDCATCPGKCNELKKCVECWLENQRHANLTCVSCENLIVIPVDQIKVEAKEKQCSFEDKEKCRFSFKYAFDLNNSPIVYIKTAKDCPEPLPIVAIVSGVSGGVVATGLFLLMLWKILTTIHDRKELAKFEKEKLKAKWNQDQNPIYIEATSTFQNPAYRGE